MRLQHPRIIQHQTGQFLFPPVSCNTPNHNYQVLQVDLSLLMNAVMKIPEQLIVKFSAFQFEKE